MRMDKLTLKNKYPISDSYVEWDFSKGKHKLTSEGIAIAKSAFDDFEQQCKDEINVVPEGTLSLRLILLRQITNIYCEDFIWSPELEPFDSLIEEKNTDRLMYLVSVAFDLVDVMPSEWADKHIDCLFQGRYYKINYASMTKGELLTLSLSNTENRREEPGIKVQLNHYHYSAFVLSWIWNMIVSETGFNLEIMLEEAARHFGKDGVEFSSENGLMTLSQINEQLERGKFLEGPPEEPDGPFYEEAS